MSETAEPAGDSVADAERAIETCVRRFYEKARADAMLAHLFVGVADWEWHFQRIGDFWSKVLLGTTRYSGFPYPVHTHMPVEPEHFIRWVALFEETARETLPPELAEAAIQRANHMSRSFQAGIFPFVDETGQPSRTPVQRHR
ncbi:group III truncated hemoglobin [Rhodomicrobium lacus]|uniref:group III truncated hemoglobin n=1 Tax=Rhodomicrobium lacus TaxID=2498452 RepID=UPI0026E3D1A3|nr:group III truncated hemoglobin [Rhodomicrobium lacus]WKW50185.1 group III truncated hemoglobin [Rhodomicrobium lacus]